MSKNIVGAATPVDLTDWARVAAMTDEEIAFDQDNPATTEADWAGAVMKVGHKTVGRTGVAGLCEDAYALGDQIVRL